MWANVNLHVIDWNAPFTGPLQFLVVIITAIGSAGAGLWLVKKIELLLDPESD